MNDDACLTGDLSEIRLPVLLMSLYRGRETGILTVHGGPFQKVLYISEGNVVFATSTNPDDRLGESLLRRGAITVRNYADSIPRIRPGKKQGEALVDLGALPADDLVEGISQQIYDIIFSIFTQEYGNYALSTDEFSTFDMITISMETPLLVFRGMSQVRSWTAMFSDVGGLDVRVKMASSTPAFLPALELSTEAEHLLSLCRQWISVASLLDASFLNQFETYRLLWIFLTLNCLEKARPAESGAESRLVQPADSEDLLEKYNAIFAYLHGRLSEAAQGIWVRLGDALAPLHQAYPALMGDQQGLQDYGRLDIDRALAVLRGVPESGRLGLLKSWLDDILYTLVFLAEQTLDEEGRRNLHEYIRRESAG